MTIPRTRIFGSLCIFCFFAGLPLLSSRGSVEPQDPGEKLNIWVSIAPQAYLVERIAGSGVEIGVLVPPGSSPETYEPSPRQMARLADADAYFRIGLSFEESVLPSLRSTMREARIVDTRDGVPLRQIEAHPHDGGEDPDHVPDPHIWLAPELMRIQARTVCETLCELEPASCEEFKENLEALLEDLEALDSRIATLLSPFRGKKLFVFHPAFGYFADAYGLQQVAVESEGKEPSARLLAELIEEAKGQQTKAVFVQREFPQKSSRAVAEEVGAIVVPLTVLPRDYVVEMEQLAGDIERALR